MPHTDGMTEKTRQLIKKIIYLAGITVAVYLGMRFALPIVIPFLLAILITRMSVSYTHLTLPTIA